jgi:small subunit ribosomal protein S19
MKKMARKEFTYRGKKLEELQSLSIQEFSELCTSRVRRSLKRGFSEEQQTLLKNLRKRNNVKTHCREVPVLPEMVGKTIQVHNGKDFVPITIQSEMVGHILGEFSLTRKRVGHSSPGVGATKSSGHVSVK